MTCSGAWLAVKANQPAAVRERLPVAHQKSVLNLKAAQGYLYTRLMLLLAVLLLPPLATCLAAPTDQDQLPPGASCLLTNQQPRSKTQLNQDMANSQGHLSRAGAVYDGFVQGSQNTLQLLYAIKSNSGLNGNLSAGSGARQTAKHQVAFRSVCNGWENSIEPQVVRPRAFWALDAMRGALVAKFIYYAPEEFKDIASHEAHLTSPIFRPIPAYHFLNESRYYSVACNLTYSAYNTMLAHLDVRLIAIPTIRGNESSSVAVNQDNEMVIDQWVMNRKEASQLSSKANVIEEGLWRRRSVSLPVVNSVLTQNSYYKVQFSAMPVSIGSQAVVQREYLNGVAIKDISLSPQCFGLQVDEKEMDRLRKLTGRDPLQFVAHQHQQHRHRQKQQQQEPDGGQVEVKTFGQFFDAYKMIILLVICCPIAILICRTVILCTDRHESLKKQRKQVTGLWRPIYWCCGLADRKRVYASTSGTGSSPTGAHHQVQRADSMEAKMKREDHDDAMMRNPYLRPLQTMLENIELNENPNYLSNGTIFGHQQQQQQQNSNGALPPIPTVLQTQVQKLLIDRKLLTLTEPLGKGAFGEVYQGYLLCYYSNNYQDDENGDSAGTNGSQLAHEAELDQLDSDSRKVAVKTLTDGRASQADFFREALNMSQVKHRNIVEFIGVCLDEKSLYIVMELLPGGNLKNFLRNNRDKSRSLSPNAQQQHRHQPFNCCASQAPSPVGTPDGRTRLCMGDLLVIALDIARACDYLQTHQYIHRDLAARNCLLSASRKLVPNNWTIGNGSHSLRPLINVPSPPESPAQPVDSQPFDPKQVDLNEVYLDGYAGSGIVTKLADFGLTRDVCASNNYYRSMGDKEVPVRWMPPEILCDGVATTKSDVWSFGVFLWELFSMGQQPYQNLLDNRQVIEFIKKRRHAPPVVEQKQEQKQQQQQQQQHSRHLHQKPPELLLTISVENVSSASYLLGDTGQVSEDCPEEDLLREEQVSLDPPLPKPHYNTPDAIYEIMCACWVTNPEDRPQFEQVARQLLCCLQMEDVLATSLPCFYEQPPATAGQFPPQRRPLPAPISPQVQPPPQQQQQKSTPDVHLQPLHQVDQQQQTSSSTPQQLNWWCP